MGRVNLSNLTFRLSAPKPVKVPKPQKAIATLLYALSFKDENGNWKAKVNTKLIPDYPDFIICDFTEKSHQLKGKENLFYTKKDKQNHWVRLILTKLEALTFEGDSLTYSPFCEKNVYNGHLIKNNDKFEFEMLDFIGYGSKYNNLIE